MNIIVNDYTKVIQKKTVLDNVSVVLPAGKVYGISGKNGSGKTMLLRAVGGLIVPSSGSVDVFGQRLSAKKPFPDSLGIVIEQVQFFNHLSAFTTLQIIAQIKKIASDDMITRTLERVGLDPEDKLPVKKFSLGMKQKLAIAQAIMEEPALILFDEPTNSLDEESVDDFYQLVKEEKERGATVLITSHHQEDLLQCADDFFHMSKGKIQKLETDK